MIRRGSTKDPPFVQENDGAVHIKLTAWRELGKIARKK
jgi:hypothetical protein